MHTNVCEVTFFYKSLPNSGMLAHRLTGGFQNTPGSWCLWISCCNKSHPWPVLSSLEVSKAGKRGAQPALGARASRMQHTTAPTVFANRFCKGKETQPLCYLALSRVCKKKKKKSENIYQQTSNTFFGKGWGLAIR